MGISASALVVSGAAALVYQSVWARMLHRVFGVGDQAIATVLGAFFLGMALGSFFGGRLSRRITSPGRAYALLELFIGGWALLTLLLLPRVHALYAFVGGGLDYAGLSLVRLALATCILLPPTIAMGATLPVLMRARPPEGTTWPSIATRLYLANTAGAILGAGTTGFVLLPRYGNTVALVVAAAMSVLAAVLVLAARLEPADAPRAAEVRPTRSPPFFLALAATTGMASLAGEVLWTRVLRIVVQGTTQAFASMLVAFLSGLVLGGFLAARALRSTKPATALFSAQLFAGVFTLVSIAAVPQLTRLVPLVVGQRNLIPHEPWSLLLVSFALLLPLATCLGASLPILFRMAEAGDPGSRTGGLLGANTLGGLVGSLAAGFVLVPLHPWGGVRNTLLGVACLHLVVALVVALRGEAMSLRARSLAFATAALALLSVFVVRPDLRLPFLLDAWHDVASTVLDGPRAYVDEPVYLREGRNTTVSVLRRGETLRLFNDGRPESGMDLEFPGFGREVALLGALPTTLAEKTETAMVIGLGGGHTVTTMLAGDFEKVYVVELEGAVVEAARTMHEERNRKAARETPFPLDDPRAELIVDDARARLKLLPAGALDAVVSQPSHPWLAGSSALYTREFFEEVRRALDDGGIFSLWVNLFRMDRESLGAVIATLHHVFPHVLAFRPDDSSLIFAASERPIVFGERFTQRIAGSRRLGELLGAFGLESAEGTLVYLELDEEGVARLARRRPVLTDDLPRLEFALAALPPDHELTLADLDELLREIPWMARSSRLVGDETLLVPVFERRLARVRHRKNALRRLEHALAHPDLTPSDRAHLHGLAAEMRGRVEPALAHYDQAATGPAITRADELLLDLGESARLLERARRRTSRPDDASALIRAALRQADADALSFVLATRDPRDMTPRPLLRFGRLFASDGCAGVADLLDSLATIRAPEPFEVLYRCLVERGDAAEAERARVAHLGRRDLAAREAFERASEAEAAGNLGDAIRHLRSTLTLLPAHPRAAIQLLELLVLEGRDDEARARLRELREVASLRGDGSRDEIDRAAERLGL